MSGPYVNDDGDIWVERGAVHWQDARREAWSVTDTSWCDGISYEGIDRGILVSDHEEQPCEAAYERHDRGEPPDCGCCRVIDAYHFRQVEV